MNTKDNARSRATREKLRASLLTLLDSYELNDLTVSQLCRHALVNRSTFYAHYEDLWSVLQELEEEIDEELLSQYRWVDNVETAMQDYNSFLLMARHVQKYPAFHRARLNNPSVGQRRMEQGMNYLTNHIILPFAKRHTDSPLLPYFMAYGKAGVFEVMRLWLNQGCKEPAEEIAKLLYEFSFSVFFHGVKHDPDQE